MTEPKLSGIGLGAFQEAYREEGRREILAKIAAQPLKLTQFMACPYCSMAGMWHLEENWSVLKVPHALDCVWVLAVQTVAQE